MTLEDTVRRVDVSSLRDGFEGQVIVPGDDGYDTYRRVWNAMIDKRPAVIARCANTDDVVRAVRFAREGDLLVSVRGGGHNVAGLAVAEDGVMIDLSGMRDVAVDPFRRRGVVKGGATWKDVDFVTHQHGLAVTGGHVGSTGVGGLTLGGGYAWLHGKYGLASDNLLGAEVVTADGDVVHASEDDNAELFWGLRGGGGNFGVVTSFEFELHSLTDVFFGALVFPRSRTAELLQAYDEFVDGCPEGVNTAIVMTVGEADNPLLPPEIVGQEVTAVIMVDPGASLEEGEQAIGPLRALGPVAEVVQPMPYPNLQVANDAVWELGGSYYWKAGRIDTLTADASDAVVEASSGPYISALIQLGGQIDRLPADATAYAHRGARYWYLVASMWNDGSQGEEETAVARSSWSKVEPHITGAFVNFLSDDLEQRAPDAFGSHARRLASIKKQYDPDNFFRLNANIKPA